MRWRLAWRPRRTVAAAGSVVDLAKSIYLQPSFSAPLMFFGGLLFGYGMVLSNGCGSRALVLLGRGNLRSFVVVIVLGIAAQMTLKGLIAPTRIALLQWSQMTSKVTSLPELLSMLGIGETLARTVAASAMSGALIVFAFAHMPFRRSWGQIAAGVAVGLLVAAGMVSRPAISAPTLQSVAADLAYLCRADRRYAAIRDAVDRADAEFRIATVAGVFAGSLATALITGRFHWEGYTSPRHMLRSAGGAALMGAGGAMAYGCSIGQGLTGLSTLALASFVAVGGILLGTAAGLRGALRVQPLAPARDA